MGPPLSFLDLASTTRESGDPFAEMFDLAIVPTARLTMDDAGWAFTDAVLRQPREAIEAQEVVFARDIALGQEAIVNPLRGRRAPPPSASSVVTTTPSEAPAVCRWCRLDGYHVRRRGLWTDDFGDVVSHGGRVCARPNWARQAPVSGIVFGDERMHAVLHLSEEDFLALFETAECYIRLSRERHQDVDHFIIFMNGGPRSAASVSHAHLQVVGRSKRHFAYAELVAARTMPDYWQHVQAAHAEVGLAICAQEASAWANVVPLKERDVTVVSSGIVPGVRLVYQILQALIRRGSTNYSLAAILSPNVVTARSTPGPFAQWPAVVWRLVDRGDVRLPYADIGSLELFGSSVVATDPCLVAEWLGDVRL